LIDAGSGKETQLFTRDARERWRATVGLAPPPEDH
jgi:hypothetical protein